MTLFRRVRPFITRSAFPGAGNVTDLISLFKYVKTIEIPYKEVININVGTNVRDRINFVEILATPDILPKYPGLLKQSNKPTSQVFDPSSISRDGFKPAPKMAIRYLPIKNGEINVGGLSDWKYLLKEWYFNTHAMLNGSMTIIGQNEYIRVGDNIRVRAEAIGYPNYNHLQELLGKKGSALKYYMTAHVESISHSFTVDPTSGARSFKTVIGFVRGIITDESGHPTATSVLSVPGLPGGLPSNIAVDFEADKIKGKTKIKNNLGTSTSKDPDTDKLEGD
jgi:hypothetical protein